MLGYYHSSSIDRWLEAGKQYALGAAWNCPHTRFRQTFESVPSTEAYTYVGTTYDFDYDGYDGDYLFPSEYSGGPANYQMLMMAW